jgi:hypothetical protein
MKGLLPEALASNKPIGSERGWQPPLLKHWRTRKALERIITTGYHRVLLQIAIIPSHALKQLGRAIFTNLVNFYSFHRMFIRQSENLTRPVSLPGDILSFFKFFSPKPTELSRAYLHLHNAREITE